MNAEWIWPEGYLTPAESAWMAAQKFAYANTLNGAGVNRALASPPGYHRHDTKARALFRHVASARLGGVRMGPESDILRGTTSYELFGKHKGAVARHMLRYCPECLSAWFHSSAFQLIALVKCPVHRCDLRGGCPHCGRPINEDFDELDFNRPLHCRHCWRPFAGREPKFTEVFGDQREFGERLRSLQLQISAACMHTTVGVVSRVAWESMPENPSLYFGALWQAAGFVPTWFLDFAGVQVTRVRVTEIVRLSGPDTVRRRARELKSIGRYLAREVHKVCGHAKPPSLDFYAIRSVTGWIEMAPPDGACACCFALAKWRVQFAMLFAAAREESGSWAKSTVSKLDPIGLTPSYALASFGLVALVMAESLGLLLPSKAGLSDGASPSKAEMVEFQLHGAGGLEQLVPILHTSTEDQPMVVIMNRARIHALLHDLARVRMLRLRSHPSFYAANIRAGIWGEGAANYQVGPHPLASLLLGGPRVLVHVVRSTN